MLSITHPQGAGCWHQFLKGVGVGLGEGGVLVPVPCGGGVGRCLVERVVVGRGVVARCLGGCWGQH